MRRLLFFILILGLLGVMTAQAQYPLYRGIHPLPEIPREPENFLFKALAKRNGLLLGIRLEWFSPGYWNYYQDERKLVRSVDDGLTWDVVPGEENLKIADIALSQQEELYILQEIDPETNYMLFCAPDSSAQDWRRLGDVHLEANDYYIDYWSYYIAVSSQGYLFSKGKRSRDNGRTWESIPLLFDPADFKTVIRPLTFLTSGVMFAANGSVLYRSHNYGLSWFPSSPNLSYIVNAVVTSDGWIWFHSYRDIFYSDDKGVTWRLSMPEHMSECQQMCRTVDGRVMIAGRVTLIDGPSVTDKHQEYRVYVFNSTTKGWDQLGESLDGAQFNNIFQSAQGTSFADVKNMGLYRLEQGQAQWQKQDDNLQNMPIVTLAKIEKEDSSLLLAASAYHAYSSMAPDYHWLPFTLRMSSGYNYSIGFRFTAFYTLHMTQTKVLLFSDLNGCYRSIDFGKTWERVTENNGKILPLSFGKFFEHQTVLYGVRLRHFWDIYKSLDQGAEWEPVAALKLENDKILATREGIFMQWDPDSTFFYRSTDECETWRKITIADSAFILEIIESASGTLFASTTIDKYPAVFTSEDQGISWNKILHVQYQEIRSIVPAPNGDVFAFLFQQFYVWSDRNKNWMKYNLEYDLNISAYTWIGERLYLGTEQDGIYYLDYPMELPESGKDDPLPPVTEKKDVQLANFPNPFNPETMIQFEISESQHVELSVYNHIGQKVADLLSETVTPGLHRIRFDGGSCASGLYFYRLQTRTGVTTGKMVLMR